MPRFNVLITRDTTESVELDVDAETRETAIEAALAEALNSADLNWAPDDGGCWGNPYFAGQVADVEELADDAELTP